MTTGCFSNYNSYSFRESEENFQLISDPRRGFIIGPGLVLPGFIIGPSGIFLPGFKFLELGEFQPG